jgi:hypothetical protein
MALPEDLNRATVPKAVQLLVDTQELHLLISLNMVVCLNNQAFNQPDRWLTNSLQASSLVSKAGMVDHLPNLLVNTLTSRWHMEVLLALVVMVVVLNKHLMLSGVRQQPKASGTDLVDTKDERKTYLTTRRNLHCNVFDLSTWRCLGDYGISIHGSSSFLSAFVPVLWWLGYLG